MWRKPFPPEVEAWLEETLSRSKPLTVAQIDVMTTEFRRAARSAPAQQQAA